jgi:hypothetical protein
MILCLIPNRVIIFLETPWRLGVRKADCIFSIYINSRCHAKTQSPQRKPFSKPYFFEALGVLAPWREKGCLYFVDIHEQPVSRKDAKPAKKTIFKTIFL